MYMRICEPQLLRLQTALRLSCLSVTPNVEDVLQLILGPYFKIVPQARHILHVLRNTYVQGCTLHNTCKIRLAREINFSYMYKYR